MRTKEDIYKRYRNPQCQSRMDNSEVSGNLTHKTQKKTQQT